MSRSQAAEDDESRLGVTDPEDFAQTERLRQIYDARQEFQKRRAELGKIRREQDLTLYETQEHLLAALQAYFFEVEGLMIRHPVGEHYLVEVELGKVQHAGDGEDRVFVGLESLADSHRPMPTPGYRKPRHDGEHAADKVVQVSVPTSVINKGFREINKFLAEVGLDADMEDEHQDAGFDYSDLLDEGPPGEESNTEGEP